MQFRKRRFVFVCNSLKIYQLSFKNGIIKIIWYFEKDLCDFDTN